jgi:methanogenic corrinoid protein MtbC1
MGPALSMQDVRSEGDALGIARQQGLRARDQRRRMILTRTVQLDVIPRLVAAHAGAITAAPALVAPPTPALVVAPAHVAELVELVLARGECAATAYVESMRGNGAGTEALYLDLLAPAARRLGVMWEEDACDFTEVTVGLWRLQSAMRELSPSFLDQRTGLTDGPRILLVPPPGESHTFGLSMVYEFFRRAGWNAWSGPIRNSAELAGIVGRERVDVIGFSLSCDEQLEAMYSEIRAVRRASLNPSLAVMVGGPPFVGNPLLATQLGADGTATDGRQAVAQAQALVKDNRARG